MILICVKLSTTILLMGGVALLCIVDKYTGFSKKVWELISKLWKKEE